MIIPDPALPDPDSHLTISVQSLRLLEVMSYVPPVLSLLAPYNQAEKCQYLPPDNIDDIFVKYLLQKLDVGY